MLVTLGIFLGGHSHYDLYAIQDEITPIPILVTTNNRDQPVYNLIVVDYDNRVIKSNKTGSTVNYLNEETTYGINFNMYKNS